jgi:hypothetical protein
MMRTPILGLFVAVGVAIGMGHLAQAAPVSPDPQVGKATTGVVATVTATGCLERWTPTATAEAQPMPKGPDGVEYVLTQVEGRSRSATAEGGGVAERTPARTRYLLLPDPSIAFATHLHQRVKIVGSIAPQPAEGASEQDQAINPSSSETNLPQGAKSEAYQDNLVEVAKLTVVARSCGK